MSTALDAWMAGYVRAWKSNAAADIEALFTEDARYYKAPYAEPWTGRADIVAGWIAEDDTGEVRFEWEPVSVTEELAVVRGRTVYRDPPETYSNMWEIRLADDGRCTEFVEWWMLHPA